MAITKSRADAVIQHVPAVNEVKTIKNVQRGVYSFSGTNGSIPLSAVNMSRSVVNVSASNTATSQGYNWGSSASNSGVVAAVFDVSAFLASPTELQVRSQESVYGGLTSSNVVTSLNKPTQLVSWEVIEYVG